MKLWCRIGADFNLENTKSSKSVNVPFSFVEGSVPTLLPRRHRPRSVSERIPGSFPPQRRGKRAAPGLHWRGLERWPMARPLLWTLLQSQLQPQAWKELPEAPGCVTGWGPLSSSWLGRSSGQLPQSGLSLGFLSSREKRKQEFLRTREPRYCFRQLQHQPGPLRSPPAPALGAVDSLELTAWLRSVAHPSWEPCCLERRPTKAGDQPGREERDQYLS